MLGIVYRDRSRDTISEQIWVYRVPEYRSSPNDNLLVPGAIPKRRPVFRDPKRIADRGYPAASLSAEGGATAFRYTSIAEISTPASQRDEVLRYAGGSAPRPLPHRAKEAQISNRLYLSLDEKLGPRSGQLAVLLHLG